MSSLAVSVTRCKLQGCASCPLLARKELQVFGGSQAVKIDREFATGRVFHGIWIMGIAACQGLPLLHWVVPRVPCLGYQCAHHPMDDALQGKLGTGSGSMLSQSSAASREPPRSCHSEMEPLRRDGATVVR
jgi:hypothetical protein